MTADHTCASVCFPPPTRQLWNHPAIYSQIPIVLFFHELHYCNGLGNDLGGGYLACITCFIVPLDYNHLKR